MKNILSLIATVCLIILASYLEISEGQNQKPGFSKINTNDNCRALKNGTRTCHCGKKRVVYDHLKQRCFNGQVFLK